MPPPRVPHSGSMQVRDSDGHDTILLPTHSLQMPCIRPNSHYSRMDRTSTHPQSGDGANHLALFQKASQPATSGRVLVDMTTQSRDDDHPLYCCTASTNTPRPACLKEQPPTTRVVAQAPSPQGPQGAVAKVQSARPHSISPGLPRATQHAATCGALLRRQVRCQSAAIMARMHGPP